MKWYDYIGVLGLIIIAFGINQIFCYQYYSASYYDFFHEVYELSPHENQLLFNLFFTGIILGTVGIGLNIELSIYNKRKNKI